MASEMDEALIDPNTTGTLRWLNWSHNLLHNKMPRYNVYSFMKSNSTFEMHRRYFEGAGNYGFVFLACLIISILLIMASVYVLHVNFFEYNYVNVFIYKTLIFVFGFAAFLCSVMAMAGHTMLAKAIKRLMTRYLEEGLDVIRMFSGYLIDAGDYAFGTLRSVKKSLQASGNTGNIIQDIAARAINAVALPVINRMLKGEAYITQLKKMMEELEDMVKTFSSKVNQYLQYLLYLLVATMIACMWMTASSFCSPRTDPFVHRVCIIVVIVWWLFGAALMPVFLILSDVCDHPAGAVAKIAYYMHKDIDPQLIHYYGDCREPNPIQPKLDTLYNAVQYVLGPLAQVVKGLGILIHKDKMQMLVEVRDYMAHVNKVGGCSWSSQQTKIMFADFCCNGFMGVGFLTCAAIFIPASLTVTVMACILLSKFKGWPESEKKLFPCPSTCYVHKMKRQTPVPCRPVKAARSEIIWPAQKEYDRRITCPITCRGHDRRKGLMNLRATCAKTCRGLLPRKPPEKLRVVKAARRQIQKKKKDKYAVCCIELYKDNECIPVCEPDRAGYSGKRDVKDCPYEDEMTICSCREGTTKGKCDCGACHSEHAQFSGNCATKKNRINLGQLKTQMKSIIKNATK